MANFNSGKAGVIGRALKVGPVIESDSVAVTGQAASDTLTMLTLPKDAVIRAIIAESTAALFATSNTLQFGVSGDAARFGSIATGAAAVKNVVASASTAPLAEDTPLVITISAASGAAAAATLRITVFYDLHNIAG